MKTALRFVDSSTDLDAACDELATSSRIAVDTEFLRETTYYPKLCLIQLRGDGDAWVIDPLSGIDLDPLRDLLLDPERLKIFHAARQDLELFLHLWDAVPRPLFDTQVAAGLVGVGEGLGLEALTRTLLDVQLPRSEARTDWSRRPLRREQLAYAAADVEHLGTMAGMLEEKLEELGRRGWLEQEQKTLFGDDKLRVDPARAWKSVKGLGRLRAGERKVGRALAQWREQAAQERNRPRRRVISDELLVAIAKRRPRSLADLEALRGVEGRLSSRDRKAVAQVAKEALKAPDDEDPSPPRRLGVQHQAMADLMSALVKLQAEEHRLAPGLLTNRAELESIARDGDRSRSRALEGWRREVVGDVLLALRAGKIRMVVEEGEVELRDVE
ncbi:MAG: ribonuclease D [Acidobacteriota bacterium]